MPRKGNSLPIRSVLTKGSKNRVGASYSRFSSDKQRETSIEDQQRRCRQKAECDGVTIPAELEFEDRIVRSTTVVREGLDSMLMAAKAGGFTDLYFFMTNRICRELTMFLPLLKKLHYKYKIRLVSVADGIDSDHPGWFQRFVQRGLHDEESLADLSANIKRGQEGTVLAHYSVGDLRFGYTSIRDPNGATVGYGRNATPRMVYAIDEEQAKYVILIFRWYVEEGRSPMWIASELTHMRAPKDHRATTPDWNDQIVRGVLRSPKYIGRWPWGGTRRVRDFETGQYRQEPVPDHVSREYLREFPHLRIISDEQYARAQSRLDQQSAQYAKHRRTDGRLESSPPRSAKKYLLDGLLVCNECGRKFSVLDQEKKYYSCLGHSRKRCSCVTSLPRDRAEKWIFATVAEELLENAAFREQVIAETMALWKSQSQTRPDQIAALKRERETLESKIDRLIALAETPNATPARILEKLRERDRELARVKAALDKSEQEQELPDEPTRESIEGQLKSIFDKLRTGTPMAFETFQRLIDGRVLLEAIASPNRKRKWIRAKFRLRPHVVSRVLLGQSGPASEEEEKPALVTLDFRPALKSDAQARRAHSMWEDGASCNEIASALKVSRSRVTAIFDHAQTSLGLSKPNTRGRRLPSDKQKRIEDLVMERWHSGLLIQQIADELGVGRPTIRRVVARWYASRGLQMPDGRARRKTLPLKQRPASGDSDIGDAPQTRSA